MKADNLLDKTFLITGASSGIGSAIAYELAARGANLIISARRTEKLKLVAEKSKQLGAGKVYLFPLDLSILDQIDRLELFIENNELTIDGLINSAGFGYSGNFVQMDFAQVEKMFQVNVLGLMYLTQRIAIKMIDQGFGEIINLASLAGKVATADYAIYAATKSAIISFSHALRLELKDSGVHLTVVNFGPVNTPFFDQIEKQRREKSLNSYFTLEVEKAAKIVVNSLGKNKREVNRPFILSMGALVYQLAPQFTEKIIVNYFDA